MNCNGEASVQMRAATAAIFLPPVTVEETAWDVLLALYSARHCELSLNKLGALTSVPQTILTNWLAGFEERKLIKGAQDTVTGEVWAVLTPAGRDLLDKYLSATSDLQIGAHH